MRSLGMESVAELRARETELAREWQWLVEAVNTIARARAEEDDAHAFRMLQAQCMAVGQRRVEVQLRIAALEGPPRFETART
jgi:hypothetical protein